MDPAGPADCSASLRGVQWLDSAAMSIPSPWPDAEMAHFLDTFLYERGAFLIDEVLAADPDKHTITGRMDTTRELPVAPFQRGDEALHPRHVSGPEMVLLTGNLGCLHAWFFHGVRWDEGWVGFGSRIHRADFRDLASLGPPMICTSTETRRRVGARRIMLRYAFEFSQQGRVVYRSDQSAMFVKPELG